MRIGVLGVHQECNTFSPIPTTLDDFHLRLGQDLVDHWRGTRTEIGGFIDILKRPDVEIVPILAGWAITKGRILELEFARMKQMLADSLRAAVPLDGMLVALHGAMCAEGADDAEGALLEVIREIVGPSLPLCLTLDLHANVTEQMCRLAGGVIGYRTYPHIDLYETATAAGEMLLRILAGEPRPRTVMQKVPMIVPGENMQTAYGPFAEVWSYAKSLQTPDVESYSIFGVQAWLDIQEMGGTVLAVTHTDEAKAREFCRLVAKRFWDLRKEFEVRFPPPATAIKEALETAGQPIVLSESSDSPTAGSPGDSADMLRALLDGAPGAPATLWLRDEAAVERAEQAGVGAKVKVSLGGAYDKINRRPVTVDAEVLRFSDGDFVMTGSQYSGMKTSMGRAVVLQVGAVTVLVSKLPAINIDPQLFRSQGIEPRDKKIVVVKSATAFRAEYKPFAARIIMVGTPGVSTSNIRAIPFQHVSRPVYPLDELEFNP
ncbi:MAG: M81 family metallopeptidase [Acidobacteriota bacterium]|nr:M81 family metallopeptidase [Acidobacteriota bacterium]